MGVIGLEEEDPVVRIIGAEEACACPPPYGFELIPIPERTGSVLGMTGADAFDAPSIGVGVPMVCPGLFKTSNPSSMIMVFSWTTFFIKSLTFRMTLVVTSPLSTKWLFCVVSIPWQCFTPSEMMTRKRLAAWLDVTGMTRSNCTVGEKDGLWLLSVSGATIWRTAFAVSDMISKFLASFYLAL